MANGHFLDEQQIAPKSEFGYAHGTTGKILLIHGDKRLIWRKGGSCWSGMTGNRYVPAELQVMIGMQWEPRPPIKSLAKGGRMSIARLKTLLPLIKDSMKLPELSEECLDIKKTFICK